MSDFGKLLKKYREVAGISINELAKLSGVDAAHISRIERDKRPIPKERTGLAIIRSLPISDQRKQKLITSAGYTLRREAGYDNQVEKKSQKIQYRSPLKPDGLLENKVKVLSEEIFYDERLPVSKRREILNSIYDFGVWKYMDSLKTKDSN